jgi:hypothetical protein
VTLRRHFGKVNVTQAHTAEADPSVRRVPILYLGVGAGQVVLRRHLGKNNVTHAHAAEGDPSVWRVPILSAGVGACQVMRGDISVSPK